MTSQRKKATGPRFTPERRRELFEDLCAHLIDGPLEVTLSGWCRLNDVSRGWPYQTMHGDPELTKMFRDARATNIDRLVEEIHATALSVTQTATTKADAAAARTKCDVLLKLIAKIDPSRYGDRLGVGKAPDMEDLAAKSPSDLAAQAAAIFNRVQERFRSEAN